MFLDNKYTKCYYRIIEKAQQRISIDDYYEKHHILPKCLGGDNTKENLVKLSYREHFICHWLLVYMVESFSKRKMQMALFKMTQMTKKQKRFYSSKQYETAKRHHKQAWSRPCSEETKRKISKSNKGKPWNSSKEELEKRSQNWKTNNPCHNPEIMKKIIDGHSKMWLIITPKNERLVIKNMTKFCRENNLHPGNMTSVAKGNLNHFKGYKCSYIPS